MTIREKLAGYTRYHAIAFFTTFLTYGFFHASRKTLSNSKDSLSIYWTSETYNETWPKPHNADKWTRSNPMFTTYDEAGVYLGVLDTLFMSFYAAGLYVFGYLGERFNLRLILAIGTLCNAITLFIFGCILPWIECRHFTIWALVWSLNGLSQSCGWPTVIGILGNWFGMEGRGFILGVWSSCQSIGNIIGALMVNVFIDTGFEYSFLFVSATLACLSILIFFTIVNDPAEVGLDVGTDPKTEQDEDNDKKPVVSSGLFMAALKIPGVVEYALSYFALKLVNYSFFFWLPYYIHNNFGWTDKVSNKVSAWFDVGGIIGGIVGGVISDMWGHRSPIVFVMVLLAVPSLAGFYKSPNDQGAASGLMWLSGFFVGGASNIIGAACSADLGKATVEYGLPSAVSIVAGIVDGTGSVGAALGQVVIPILETRIGWSDVFYMFMIMAGVSG